MSHSLAEENYLKALFNIASRGGEVNVAELSKTLEIKMPTVTSMMKRLAGKKLVHYESYKPPRLTEKGKKEAGLIIRKHRLTETFLVNKMKLGWENVHDIAEQIEHIQSRVFFDKMDELLDFPKLDPHGSPIPDRNGKIVLKDQNKLSDCQPGETVRISGVINGSSAFLKFLTARELKLGSKLKVKSVETFDKSIKVGHSKRTLTLSNVVSERLLVEKEKASGGNRNDQ